MFKQDCIEKQWIEARYSCAAYVAVFNRCPYLFRSVLKVEDTDRSRRFKIESTYILNQTKIRNSLRCLLGLQDTDMIFDVLGSWKKKQWTPFCSCCGHWWKSSAWLRALDFMIFYYTRGQLLHRECSVDKNAHAESMLQQICPQT